MPESRIFIGNLNTKIKEKHLKEKFSEFGEIKQIEMKTKLDIEGQPIMWFAYLNLEGDQQRIINSINSLDGSTLKGSIISVQLAKESFLERLKREREGNSKKPNAEENCSNLEHRENFVQKTSFYYGEFAETNYKENEDYSYNSQNVQGDFLNKKKEFSNDSIHSYGYENCDRDRKERILSTYERYDPTKEDKISKYLQERPEKKNSIKDKCVKVSGELTFKSEESTTFSFLQKFEEAQGFHDDTRTPQNEERKDLQILPCITQRYNRRKNHKFFLSADDPEFKNAAEWLLTPLTKSGREEFLSVKSDLLSLCLLQHKRAVKNAATGRSFASFGKGGTGSRGKRGRGRGNAKNKWKLYSSFFSL